MAKFVRNKDSGITRDYVNLPEPKSDAQQPDGGTAAVSGRKLYQLAAVSFGLLCILQAALNISPRLALFIDARHTNLTEETDLLREELLPFDRYFQEGWVYVRPSFYYISSSEKKSWQESRNDCLQRGADLVVINSKNEQDFTRKFQLKVIWIGLTTGDTNDSWIWVDGTPLEKSYWSTGEPNNFRGNESCVETRFRWNDRNCVRENHWICEKMIA